MEKKWEKECSVNKINVKYAVKTFWMTVWKPDPKRILRTPWVEVDI